NDLRHTEVKSPELARALLEFAQLELEDRHFDEAIAILDDARVLRPEAQLLDQINLLSAQAQYLAKRFEVATMAFEQIGRSTSPWAKLALFNASSGWLQLGDHARFLADYNALEKQGGDEESRASLRLEEGLMQAAKGDKKAAESLQQFVRDFPKDPRVSEAWVGLAELAFHSTPPRLGEARKNLVRAADSSPTTAAAERADYLIIWIEDSADVNDRKMVRPQDEILLLDEMLKGEAAASEKEEALCGKGDIFFEMAGNDSNNYQRAIEVYDRLASDKNEPIHWRNQALFKKGLC